uniref:Heat shock protein 70 n=1 Tax=Ditylenchus dipsaci TaxID=166011 RepID=A0A915ET53_9BILA
MTAESERRMSDGKNQLLSSFCCFLLPQDVVKQEYGTIIGIDLGTTYSCFGIYKNGKVDIIANEQGNRITPSYNQLTANPENTIFDTKRLIGREFSDEKVQEDKKLWPFQIVDKNNKPRIEVNTGNG